MVSPRTLNAIIKVRVLVPHPSSLLGDSVTGNTTDFDSVIVGSNPTPPAKIRLDNSKDEV